MAALGFHADDFAAQDRCAVWPENWPHVEVFDAMRTQWRVGPHCPIGLDYGVLPVVLRLRSVPRADWPATFEALRTMEEAALDEMSRK